MKHKIRTLAVAALVAASALALPTAAQADTIYPPSNACNVVPLEVLGIKTIAAVVDLGHGEAGLVGGRPVPVHAVNAAALRRPGRRSATSAIPAHASSTFM